MSFLEPSTSGSLTFWSGEVSGTIDYDTISPWNTLRLDGDYFPGRSAPMFIKEISGKVGFDVDRRQRKNRSGRKKVATGSKSPKWSMLFSIITPEQYAAWQAILPQINPKLDANRAKVRQVYHPFLADYEITQAFIYEMDIPRWGEGLIADVTIYFEDVGAPDTTEKKTLKPTNNPEENQAALDDRYRSENPGETEPPGPPAP